MAHDRPTLATVARAAGVSPMTVSNAYNRPDQLSSATRERVLAVAASLGYAGPDPAARSLRRRRAGTVGVVLTDELASAFGDPGTVSFLHGLATELGAAEHSLLLLPSDHPRALVRDAVVDGFVLVSVTPGSETLAEVRARGLPVVTFGSARLRGMPHVSVDNAAGARLVAEHLLALGHRRFAVLTVGGTGVASRHVGFRARADAVLEAVAGVTGGEAAVLAATSNGFEPARAAIAPVLAQPAAQRPTAVVAVTDVMALGVLAAAQDAGVAVPQELSVAGFDGIEDAARSVPPLTTVAQDLFGQGRLAARALLDRVAGRQVRVPVPPVRLVPGGTTRPPPSSIKEKARRVARPSARNRAPAP